MHEAAKNVSVTGIQAKDKIRGNRVLSVVELTRIELATS